MIRKRNQGSAVIEMTLLMPIILGIFFLYISTFLCFISESKYIEAMSNYLYSDVAVENSGMNKVQQGGKVSVFFSTTFGQFDMDLELHRNEDNAVENIRRWQFATDTLRAGENE